jgi:Domain of unknown function (DUF4410)
MAARSTFRAFALTLGLPVAALALVGCNTVNSTSEATIAEQRMARPAAIVVQPFAISPDAPTPTAGGAASASGADAAQAAQKFRDALAANLVSAIRAMRLPAVRADAPLPAGGSVMTLEGRFVSVPAGDSAEPAIVRLADSWPDVVVDVEIYDTSDAGDRLVEDMEFRISETNPLIPPTTPAGVPTEAQTAAAISPAVQAKLDAAARDGATAIAEQLRPFFADQCWIAPPPGS